MIPMLARTIQGCYVGNLEDMTELMELVSQGKIPPIPVDVREASADTATAALDDLRNGKVAGRAVLRFQG
jgi:D-arabinose 1-dehydrogenase-like Zn-dependent alcohol dehydrogenase